jgi:hypothetical protein
LQTGQRGATSLSVAGSVAAALRLCMQEALTARTPEIRRSANRPPQRTGADNYGIGARTILAKLEGVRGINRNVIDVQPSFVPQLPTGQNRLPYTAQQIAEYPASKLLAV